MSDMMARDSQWATRSIYTGGNTSENNQGRDRQRDTGETLGTKTVGKQEKEVKVQKIQGQTIISK